MATLAMAIYGLEVPAGDVAISARPEIPAAFRITMAAIDPSASAEGEDDAIPRATLKIIRQPLLSEFDDDEDDDEDDEDESDFDEDEMNALLAEEDDEDEDSDDEDLHGGPSDPAKSKKARKEAAEKEIKKMLEEEMDVDGEPNGVNGSTSDKGKGKLIIGEDFDDDSEDDDDESGGEIEEFVICTLDPTKNYQQPIDLTVGEDERVWFKVSGTHSIFLTGNYIEPAHQHGPDMDDYDSEDEEDMYDLPPDSDELDEDGESEDELDDLEDPRVMEVDSEEEEAPKLVKVDANGSKKGKKDIAETVAAAVKADKKGKNKRPADESADEDDAKQSLDDLISKAAKAEEPATNGEQKLSKKQLKKLKNNAGAAAAAPADEVAKKEAEAPSSSSKADKKVSFAKELEQGPTPSPSAAKADQKDKSKATLGVKAVQGVKIDDKKLGSGPAAKKGDRVGMRYIGKLESDNKVFDHNKKGKPFSFKLGSGDVIKGWDIGVAGMSVGQERRITVPAHLAYGSQKMPGIPPNSTLVFDMKLIELNKGK